MGHIGLTPQSVHQLGGYKVQGKDHPSATKLLEDAKILEDAGAFSIVLECVPAPLAEKITASLSMSTIGIGGGVHCDGQVLVVHDMLGLFERFTPKFVKKYTNLNVQIKGAVTQYIDEVKKGASPDPNTPSDRLAKTPVCGVALGPCRSTYDHGTPRSRAFGRLASRHF